MLDNFAHLYKVKIMAEEIRDNNEELRIGVYVCQSTVHPLQNMLSHCQVLFTRLITNICVQTQVKQ